MIRPISAATLLFFLAAFIPTRADSQPGHGERIVVANEHASTVQFFDLATGKLLKDIATLKRPHEMVVDREAGVAYVSIAYKDGPWDQYESPGNQIQVIDLQKMEIISTIDITPHWAPHGLALDRKNGLLYASCESNGGEVIGVDVKQKKVMGSVKVGVPHPHSLAVVPSVSKAYTANKDVQHISVVDLKEMKLLKDIPAPTGTDGIIATPDGKYVFVGNFKGTQLLVVDPRKDEVVERIPFDLPPSTFALSPDGSKLYITFHDLGTRDGKQVLDQPGFVQELDVATLKLGAKIEVGHFPLNMTVTPDGKTGVVDTTADGALAVIDLAQMRVIRRIKTDEWPHGVVVF
jgi:DNA-binding beta-propeller fold protein YncE